MALITPKARASFVDTLWEAKAFQGEENGKKSYGITLLFDEEAQKTLEFKALLQEYAKVRAEAWGPDEAKWPWKANPALPFRIPFQKGETKDYDGYGPGIIFINPRSTSRPAVVNRNLTPISRELGNDNIIYSGCYVRASLSCFAYGKGSKIFPKGSPGVSFGLSNVQFWEDGSSLTARRRPDEDFQPLADEPSNVTQPTGAAVVGNVDDLWK